ncbi:hypothetical protein ACIQ8G_25875 [Streptomyces sp. NPDC094154]|uniref:hypothetical protein n=1 Tax=Streptomyces sp. NPDC094154 TaxID=3366059 RepID=UPI0037FBCEA5
MPEITAADREHAARMSGLDVDAVKHIAGETRDELVTNARTVSRALREKKQTEKPAVKPADDSEAIDPAKLAAAIAKRMRF